MKTIFKLTKWAMLVLALITYSCNNDDDAQVVEINLQDFTVTIDENPTNGQVVGTVQADGGSTSGFTISSQTPTGALSINSNSGELTVADATLFDFETNSTISATITVVNASEPATVTVNLNDLDEISAEDVTFAIDENPTNGQSIDTIEVDGEGTLSFSITSQTPQGALSIDESSGELTVTDATVFDFETNPVITAIVSIDNSINTVMSTVTINLNDLDEISAEDLTIALDENPTDGQVVGTIQVNGGGTLSFGITSQTPTGALNIDAGTGELTVADPNLFDFETNPVIIANIEVDNGVNTAMAIATISLNDVDEITVQDLTIDIDENPSNGQVIGTIQATSAGSLIYTITYQSTVGALSINQNTGELSVADHTLFDFETNPNMFAVISVDNSVYSVNANATINLNDIAEAATVGDFRDGGVVFWVDPLDNTKGLVCAVNNVSFGAEWGCSGTVTSATGTAIGTGATNTITIEASCTTAGTAADLCANLVLNGYDDWFLPSRFELLELYNNKDVVNATALANGGSVPNQFHWSSSDFSTTHARIVNLTTGTSGGALKTFAYGVRPVRAF